MFKFMIDYLKIQKYKNLWFSNNSRNFYYFLTDKLDSKNYLNINEINFFNFVYTCNFKLSLVLFSKNKYLKKLFFQCDSFIKKNKLYNKETNVILIDEIPNRSIPLTDFNYLFFKPKLKKKIINKLSMAYLNKYLFKIEKNYIFLKKIKIDH